MEVERKGKEQAQEKIGNMMQRMAVLRYVYVAILSNQCQRRPNQMLSALDYAFIIIK